MPNATTERQNAWLVQFQLGITHLQKINVAGDANRKKLFEFTHSG
jgi:hypothetical protein